MQADLIIHGAGLVGLSLALRCAQENYKVILNGKKPPPSFPLQWESSDNRYSTINRRSQKLFEALGVWESMAAKASPYTRMVVWDACGFGPLTFDAEAIHQPDLGHVIANAWMLEVLWQTVLQHPNIYIDEREALALQRDSSYASLTFVPVMSTNAPVMSTNPFIIASTPPPVIARANGPRQSSENKALLVIDASGAKSWLREAAGIQVRVTDDDQSTLATTVRTEKTHRQTAWQRFLPEGPVAFLPLVDPHQSLVFWTAKTAQIQNLLAQEESLFAQELTHALDDQLGAVVSVGPRQSFALQGQVALSYIAERVALVGDAMHVIHPLAGQGLNLGLADVESLVQTILHASRRAVDLGHPLVLRRYARARKAAVQTMSYATRGLNNLFCSQHPALIALRTLGLEGVQRMPWVKTQLAFQAMGI